MCIFDDNLNKEIELHLEAQWHRPALEHRLLIEENTIECVKRRVADCPTYAHLNAVIIQVADELLSTTPIQRYMTGSRLLYATRAVLQRVTFLGYAYKMTQREAYAQRCIDEMLNAITFEDWNPSHFLDTAEMATALGIGYNWLYPLLSPDLRLNIRTAIIEKAIEPSFLDKYTWWVSSKSNWGQVCHAGLSISALAILHDAPDIAKRVVVRALENIPGTMEVYGPDGAYPEGAMYWEYGTLYNVLFIQVCKDTLGTDFGLTSTTGFCKSARYYSSMVSPSGKLYSYSDSRLTVYPSVALPWFARHLNEPELLWYEAKTLPLLQVNDVIGNATYLRFLPFALMWGSALADTGGPKKNTWWGRGITPVATHRTGNELEDAFVGLKGGSALVGHAHMDSGSFVFDRFGERWVEDLELLSYELVESAKLNLFGFDKDSDRWTLPWLGLKGHSTLMVGNSDQNNEAFAPLHVENDASDTFIAHVDLSETYNGMLENACRTFTMDTSGNMTVTDKVTASDETFVDWSFVTCADYRITGQNRITLTLNDREIHLAVMSTNSVQWHRDDDFEASLMKWNHPTKCAKRLYFRVPLTAGEPKEIEVRFVG